MFRIAKNLVKTFEQTVSDTVSRNNNRLDVFFQSIPPNLIASQFSQDVNHDFTLPNNANELISGLRILYVEEWQLQLQSFFDYIVGINDFPLPMYINNYGFMYPDYNAILNLINDSVAAGFVKLNIWSAKGGRFRDEYLNLTQRDENDMDSISLDIKSSTDTDPNQDSAAQPQQHASSTGITVPILFQSLGIKIQWTPLIASTFTYHILQLNIENGPAQAAGLIPDEDYIIGCQDGLLATGGNELLADVIRSRTNQSLVLYIYNKVSDSVRPVTVNIGPDGRLGCNIGYGFLHRIPATKTFEQTNIDTSTTHTTTPSSSTNNDQTFVPNSINTASATAPPLPPQTTTPRTSKKKKHVHSTTTDMNDYFNEGKDPRTAQNSDNTASISPPPIIPH